MTGVEVREGQKHGPYLHDPGKPPKDAKGWPHFTCGALGRWAAGAGRVGCRLGQGYGGMRRDPRTPRVLGIEWPRAWRPRRAARARIGRRTRPGRSPRQPSWRVPGSVPSPATPIPIRRSAWKVRVTGTSRRDPPRSVPPPTVPTGGHPCPGARLGPQVGRREVLEYWANNSVRGVSHGHFVTPRTVAPGPFSDVCPSPPASPGSWARLCAQCVGLDRPGGEARREGPPWRVGVPHGGSGSGRSAGPPPRSSCGARGPPGAPSEGARRPCPCARLCTGGPAAASRRGRSPLAAEEALPEGLSLAHPGHGLLRLGRFRPRLYPSKATATPISP